MEEHRCRQVIGAYHEGIGSREDQTLTQALPRCSASQKQPPASLMETEVAHGRKNTAQLWAPDDFASPLLWVFLHLSITCSSLSVPLIRSLCRPKSTTRPLLCTFSLPVASLYSSGSVPVGLLPCIFSTSALAANQVSLCSSQLKFPGENLMGKANCYHRDGVELFNWALHRLPSSLGGLV